MWKEAGPVVWWKLREIAESEGVQLLGDWSESEEETESELGEAESESVGEEYVEEEEESEGSEDSEELEYDFGSSDSEDYSGEQEDYTIVFGARV